MVLTLMIFATWNDVVHLQWVDYIINLFSWYAQQRKTFGEPIANRQAIQIMLAWCCSSECFK